MNREIKFRCWDIKRRKMYLEIQLQYSEEKWMALPYGAKVKPLEDFELMQFTGLKDKNGKEIYDSDLVKNSTGRIMEVTWLCGEVYCGWDLKYRGGGGKPQSYPQWRDLEIIGNIYENPELLK